MASPIPLMGHHGPVYGACFSAKGQYLLSSSEDCTVRLWDVDKRSCVVCYRGHQYPVWNVAFRYCMYMYVYVQDSTSCGIDLFNVHVHV